MTTIAPDVLIPTIPSQINSLSVWRRNRDDTIVLVLRVDHKPGCDPAVCWRNRQNRRKGQCGIDRWLSSYTLIQDNRCPCVYCAFMSARAWDGDFEITHDDLVLPGDDEWVDPPKR
jgi:hypothetical protein